MAYPPSYERDFSFTEFESLNPGQPKPGASLDAEFDDVSVAVNATQDALALIQRSDGQLANDSVGEDQLQDDVFDGIVDGITAEAEAAALAATNAASAAATSATSAATSASAASTQAGLAAGSAALAGSSQTIAQDAANEAALSASDAETSANDAELAANETAGSVAETQAAVDLAYKWAEYLAGPVMPAPGGYPEAVDDGMWSSKWWALRARDYSGFTPVDFGSGAGDIGDAYDAWIALGNELPPGNILAEWNGITYWLIDSNNPSDPASWIRITGEQGPPGVDGTDGIDGAPGPANSLAIGTVTTLPPGSPATATITGTPPAQTLSLGIPQGATGSGGTGAGATPTALVGLVAIAGAASTLIRSDGAPALSQAIAPTWTEKHIFSKARVLVGEWALQLRSSAPSLQFTNTSGAVDSKSWAFNVTPTNFTAYVHNDAESAAANWLSVARVANTIASVSFGNTADNPVFNFLGTGAATFNGQAVFMQASTGFLGTPAILLSSTTPAIVWNETDAAVDNRAWYISAGAAGSMYFGARNDAATAGANFMEVERTGIVVNSIQLNAVTTIGPVTGFDDLLHLRGTNPYMRFDNASGTSLGYIQWTATGGNLVHETGDLRFWTNNTHRATFGLTGHLTLASGYFLGSGMGNATLSQFISWGPPAGNTYGSCYVYGAQAGYTGIAVSDGTLNPVFMSNGTSYGIYCQADARWLITRSGSTVANTAFAFEAPSFNATSSRKLKRETGKPTRAADILSRLRPILYRLLADEDTEQLGMIAEEVHDVCPQLSNGKSISYDRLAILLLADWQEAHGVA